MEFLARFKLLLRKSGLSNAVLPFTIGGYQFDPYSRRLTGNNKEIHLSNIEGSILSQLLLHKGKVVTFLSFANTIWGDDYPGCKDAIQVYIRRLRQKIEDNPSQPQLIHTKIGIGYFLNDDEVPL
jgi:two-component system KDP operon response regulator KdpE